MKESYGEGLAAHTGPESCAAIREALTGGRAGRVFSRERASIRSADAVRRSGRPHSARRQRKTCRGSARSETPGMPAGAAQSDRATQLGADAAAHSALAAPSAHHSSLSPAATWRCHLRQEPSAVIPHAGICGGGYE